MMNYGQLARAVDMVEDSSIGVAENETPVQICIDGAIHKDVIGVYLDKVDGKIVVVIEAAK